MLDTTVFNQLLRDQVDLGALAARGALVSTYVQHQELQATRDAAMRDRLLSVFRDVATSKIPTSSSVWDEALWDEAKWSPEDGLYEHLLVELNRLKPKPNNYRDALIAETAIRNALCLITDDWHLARVTRAFGGNALRLQDFLAADSP
jgi:predicted nucleic acid-binding protein